jgi:cation diffusion facilitator family transporter
MPSKLKAAGVSILANTGLLISKLIVAVITGSVGMLAECLHSGFDLVASFLAFIGIKIAQRPDDETHHFGHEKYESLSSFLQSMLIAITAVLVIFEAYHKFTNPGVVESPGLGIVLMIITIPVAIFVSRYLAKIAKSSGGSHALEADSAHFTTDVIASIAVLLGLLCVKLGFPQGDAIAAIVVALIMLYIAFKLMKITFFVFMDYSPDALIMKKIRRTIADFKGVHHHKLRARMAGSKVLVEFHIQVKGTMTVIASHEKAMQIKRKLMKKLPCIKDVTIHVEPKGKHRKIDD